MKKRYGLFGMLVLMCLLLAACGCKHEWKDANCEMPKTCTLCGKTEGEKLEHQWKDATCESPKTCALCQKTEGEALGHLYPPVETSCEEPLTCDRCGKPEREARPHTWKDATCTEPRSCMSCWMTEGEPLGHSWQEATCEAPKTCTLCGLTEGMPLGHSWMAATCENPKTCENCGTADGEAKGHTWQEATCVTPKLCTVCYATEGEALGHDWQEATSKDPKTCRVCGLTDGEKIQVDSRFETDRCKFLFGKWKGLVTETMIIGGKKYTVEYWAYYEFNHDGTGSVYIGVDDREAFLSSYEEMLAEGIYAEAAKDGISRAQADKMFKDVSGMSIAEYCRSIAEEFLDMMSEPQKFVYYVMGGKIYMADRWKGDFTGESYDKVGKEIHLESGIILVPNG